jgi:hypothetical protein
MTPLPLKPAALLEETVPAAPLLEEVMSPLAEDVASPVVAEDVMSPVAAEDVGPEIRLPFVSTTEPSFSVIFPDTVSNVPMTFPLESGTVISE